MDAFQTIRGIRITKTPPHCFWRALNKGGVFLINSEISSIIVEEAFDYLDAPIKRLSSKDVPMPYALNLEKQCLVQPNDIVQAVKEVCYKE